MLVGRGGANRGIHDKEHSVGEVDRDLGLGSNRRVDSLSVGLPATGVDDREVTVVPLGLVVDAVASNAGGVLHHSFTAADDAVDESRLADVRATNDRQNGKGGQVVNGIRVIGCRFQNLNIVVVEVVVTQSRTKSRGALGCLFFVHAGESLDEVRV